MRNTKLGISYLTVEIAEWGKKVMKDFIRNRYAYLMALPVVAYFIVFHYIPMYGAIIAFKDYSPLKGIWGSEWVGFKHFEDFFGSIYFWRLIRNTLLISLYSIIFGFPVPIIFALLLNEIRNSLFKRVVQTATYMPHFLSLVVVAGMIVNFTSVDGLINDIIAALGGERIPFLMKPEYFRLIYVASGIWQEFGFQSIIYLAAITNIDPQLYEAARIDGANRWQQLKHITLPGILPTIVILFILRIGNIMNVGYEKIILLYNPATYETADVISTFVFRRGLIEFDYSFATAVGLFNSVVNFVVLIIANEIAKRLQETSLW